MDVTPIDSINGTSYISQNNYVNVFHNYYAPLLSSNNQEYLSPGTEFESQCYPGFIIKENKVFRMAVFFELFF